jgi:1-acyl-sn-glycerol-3-phosphate acyltransferase
MGISWFWFFGATLLAQFPAYSREVLGGDATVFILLLTLFSFGIGLGSLLCERLSGRRVELGLVPLGALGLTLFGADLALASPVHTAGAMHFTAFLAMAAHWRLMADIVLTGLFGGFFIVPLYALIQTRADKSRQSRIIAANNILNALFMVVSAVVSMLLFRAGCSIPQLFLATALFNAVVAAWLMALVPEFLARFLSWTLVRTFCRLEREHLERIPEEGAALLVSNRVSAVDVLLILAASPRPIRFVLERRLFAVPVLGFLLRRMRAIPADAGRAEFDRAFREGDLVAVFPEGRRTPDGAPGEFDAGLVERVERVRVPVLPIGLGGSAGRRAGALPARVSLRVGAPLGPEGLPGSLRAGIQALM